MANEGYHEPVDELSDETKDMHRAITSYRTLPTLTSMDGGNAKELFGTIFAV